MSFDSDDDEVITMAWSDGRCASNDVDVVIDLVQGCLSKTDAEIALSDICEPG